MRSLLNISQRKLGSTMSVQALWPAMTATQARFGRCSRVIVPARRWTSISSIPRRVRPRMGKTPRRPQRPKTRRPDARSRRNPSKGCCADAKAATACQMPRWRSATPAFRISGVPVAAARPPFENPGMPVAAGATPYEKFPQGPWRRPQRLPQDPVTGCAPPPHRFRDLRALCGDPLTVILGTWTALPCPASVAVCERTASVAGQVVTRG
jgi:hypothetical protein